jgi:ferric-dicitrate binding protein FerR (iron transport regulator)
MIIKEELKGKIERYISGLADDKETDSVQSLFSDGENNIYLRHRLEEDWNVLMKSDEITEVKLKHLLDRIHHIIRKNEIREQQKPYRKILRIYMKFAAIILVPLLVAAGFSYNFLGNRSKSATALSASSTIYAPMGARVSFKLPDGTTGMLNSGSHLTYSLPFITKREVSLEGEGWFEVFHDENHPFNISTGISTVKVLGTSFNMSAYPSEDYVEVVLQKGKVEFLDKKSDKRVTMLPSERLVFQDGNISKSVTDAEKFRAWTQGKLVFRGDLMAEVARRIERWYNVKIVLADKELEKYSFRATFEDDKIEDVLRLLSMTSPLRYEISPGKLMPDGTYNKEKVTIYLKK